MNSLDRTPLINAILDAAKRPMPEIAESSQLLCTDGEWRNCMGIPHGVQAVKPYQSRVVGYVWRDKNGTTYGTRAASPDELRARHAASEAGKRAEFLTHLEKATDKELQSQASYWLKTANA